MMHGLEKSDSAVVAMKPANNAGSPAAERVEPRAGTKGNADPPRTRRTQSRDSVSQGLERVRQAARQRKRQAFTALLHHVNVDALRDAFLALKRRAAPGVDGMTWQDYESGLEEHLQDLHARVHRGTYRALPVRRRFIPKPDGRQRPLGIAALEDKIVQRAVVTVLNAIYEEDFLGLSYGLLRVSRGACQRPRNWGVPASGHRSVAAFAEAAPSEGPNDLGADRPTGRRVVATTPCDSSLAGGSPCRQIPEVGAVCPNRARTDLCGGCRVTGIPTAIADTLQRYL